MAGLRVEATYEQNQMPDVCAICGRSTSGRFSPPVRFTLLDGDDELGDVCERCAYGSVDLWRVALIEYAIRLETQAAVLRDLASRVDRAQPAQEGIAKDLIQQNVRQNGRGRRPGQPPPWLRGNNR